MDYKYLLSLNELNVEFPTYTDEEKGLAKYLEYNSEADHDRRKLKNEVAPKSGGTVSGSFNTLLSPGYSQLYGGGLAQLGGGLLGGLGAGSQWRTAEQYRNQLQQQHLAANQYAALQQQQSAVMPGTAQNNPNPLKNIDSKDALMALLAQQKGNGPH